MSVKKKQNIFHLTLPVMILPLFVAGNPGMAWMGGFSLVALLVWLVMVAIFWRCPYCKKKLSLLPGNDIEVCKHCGRDLTEED